MSSHARCRQASAKIPVTVEVPALINISLVSSKIIDGNAAMPLHYGLAWLTMVYGLWFTLEGSKVRFLVRRPSRPVKTGFRLPQP